MSESRATPSESQPLPLIKLVHQVLILTPRKSYAFNDFYGFGYDGVSRDNYKILRFYDERIFEDRHTGKYDPPVEIYDLKANSWKTLDISLDWVVYSPCTALSAFRGDKLSLLHQRIYEDHDQVGETTVWVTNSVKDKVVSWTKLFVVWRPDLPAFNLGEVPPHSVFFIDQK
ncbi:putative F-box protein At3g22650 [Capsella rubella]|uniref:putative F-box protein At3g22650 n=1 Tax=Capsella rubella TaxID=81985 RepID=UPI000CD55250|nr:putative F-box protein At3g22650 [Capsella rubella]